MGNGYGRLLLNPRNRYGNNYAGQRITNPNGFIVPAADVPSCRPTAYGAVNGDVPSFFFAASSNRSPVVLFSSIVVSNSRYERQVQKINALGHEMKLVIDAELQRTPASTQKQSSGHRPLIMCLSRRLRSSKTRLDEPFIWNWRDV